MLTLTIISYAQTLDCNFKPKPLMFNTTNYTALSRNSFNNDTPIVFNVKFHVVNNADGNAPNGITENKLLEYIAHLNLDFNQFNIFYKYRGFINYNDIYDLPVWQVIQTLDLINNYPNSINVLIPLTAQAATGDIDLQRVIIPATEIVNSSGLGTMSHEFGHLLGLFHTFYGTDYAPNCLNNSQSEFCIDNDTQFYTYAQINGMEIGYAPPRLNTPNFYEDDQFDEDGELLSGHEENVTRDVNDPNFNANNKGDMVIDTPAQFRGSQFNYFFYFQFDGYHYISHPNIVDLVGEPYENIDIENIMGYTELIRRNFTNGQGVRMRETINNNPSIFNRVETTIASLYEPYAGEYQNLGSQSPNLSKFQPGFDYTFIQCGGDRNNYGIEIYNQPTDYSNTSFLFSPRGQIFKNVDKFSLDLPNLFHPNHSAIFIEQLNTNSLQNGGQPRKCYNNFNRSSIGGKVIKFEDNTINNNISIEQKDAQEINDTNLVPNLQQGLYKIEKNYDDGSKKQDIIYKSDN